MSPTITVKEFMANLVKRRFSHGWLTKTGGTVRLEFKNDTVTAHIEDANGKTTRAGRPVVIA